MWQVSCRYGNVIVNVQIVEQAPRNAKGCGVTQPLRKRLQLVDG
jgi:hypothetical protein